MDIERTKIKSITCLGEIDDYVYDISIDKEDPFFFANDILVHNTDSVYFSAWPVIKNEVEAGNMSWNKDTCIEIYNSIADQVNTSFPTFMEQAFHCPRSHGELIRGGRELVASKGLFITKKRYAVLIYDKENKRQDINGKSGKIKAMGLDLKRADTPKFVQEFLSNILEAVLEGIDQDIIIERIRDFKKEFVKRPPWEKGTPKRVNNLTHYGELDKTGSATLPGHVRAALNWNKLKYIHADNYSQTIIDGQKVIVCKLRNNPMNFTSVAYPIDEKHLPSWFLELPFDDDSMEDKIVDKKIENLLGVLDWNLNKINYAKNTFDLMFG